MFTKNKHNRMQQVVQLILGKTKSVHMFIYKCNIYVCYETESDYLNKKNIKKGDGLRI